MGKNSTVNVLKDPNATTTITPSSGRKTSSSVVLAHTNSSRQNAGAAKSTLANLQNEKMATTNNEVVLKSGWMTKRSQLKSIFSFTNYRERYFQLTKSALVYYDTAPPITQGSSSHGKNKRGRKYDNSK